MIVCAAVVGQQNAPLYLRTFLPGSDDHTLKFHYIVHCSLDAVEEKVLLRRSPGEASDSYLGLLHPTEEFQVYGYISNTNVKFILVLDDYMPKEDSLSKVLRRLHGLYVDVTSNPFHSFGLPIKSAKFDAAVDMLVSAYSKSGN